MNCEIISVGTELLLGQILNTNCKYISEKLTDIGVDCYFQTTVGDNENRIIDAVKIAEQRSNIIILTGGLGPTEDDLTKSTLAKHLGVEIILHEESMQRIVDFFQKRKVEMTINNKKQAEIFKDSTPLLNDNGLAVGVGYKQKNIKYIILPGPPKECELMFNNYGIPFILDYKQVSEKIYSKSLRYLGISESKLAEVCDDIINTQKDPSIATLTGKYDVMLRLTTKAKNDNEANLKFTKTINELNNLVGNYLYCFDNDNIFDSLIKLLTSKKLTISSAESFTGGGFVNRMTTIPGASKVVIGSICAYDNKVKKSLLNVSEDTLISYGAVSNECAIEMSKNVRNIFDSDIGISFTGVAGPDEQEGNKVGTVYISISTTTVTNSYYYYLHGNRESIREKAILHACAELIKMYEN